VEAFDTVHDRLIAEIVMLQTRITLTMRFLSSIIVRRRDVGCTVLSRCFLSLAGDIHQSAVLRGW